METVWTAHGQGLKEIPENTCSHTWPHISCTRKIHGKTIVIPFFCTISRMKLDKDFLKNLTIIKNTIMRDQKNE